MRIRAFTIGFAVLAIVAGVVVAQRYLPLRTTPGTAKDNSASPPAAVPQQTVTTKAPAMPHVAELMVLLRSTLLAVNQANLTANYTVLRDLGTPDFQRKNSAVRLMDNFQSMRSRNIDIGPIAVLKANLVREPSIDANGSLRLTGFFPSQPEQVNFDLAFQMVDGRWRFHAMALNTQRNERPVAATGSPTQPETPPVPVSEPEAIKEPTAATTNGVVAPVTPPDKKAPSEKKASAAPTKPVSAAEPSPDIRDEVDSLEASPAPDPKPKPKEPKESHNPFVPF